MKTEDLIAELEKLASKADAGGWCDIRAESVTEILAALRRVAELERELAKATEACQDACADVDRLIDKNEVVREALNDLIYSCEQVQDWPLETRVGASLERAAQALAETEEP